MAKRKNVTVNGSNDCIIFTNKIGCKAQRKAVTSANSNPIEGSLEFMYFHITSQDVIIYRDDRFKKTLRTI